MRHRTVLGLTLSRLIGIVFFLLLLMIANILQINDPVYIGIISFLNANIALVIVFSVMFFLGELFFIFFFPFNLPAPIFNAVGGVLLADFVFKLFSSLGTLLNESSLSSLATLEPWVDVLIFFIIIIVGYVWIFSNIGRGWDRYRDRRERYRRYRDERYGRGERYGRYDDKYDKEKVERRIREARERVRNRMSAGFDRMDERMARREERREEKREEREERRKYRDELMDEDRDEREARRGERENWREEKEKIKDDMNDFGDEVRKTAHTVVRNIRKILEPKPATKPKPKSEPKTTKRNTRKKK